ncbi:hypothetical protein H0H93_013434, partial [Arthromyces matolae]
EREYDLRAHDDENEDTRVGERVAVRILKILEPLRVTNPEYDMHLPVPREGELLPSRMKKAPLLINLDKGVIATFLLMLAKNAMLQALVDGTNGACALKSLSLAAI